MDGGVGDPAVEAGELVGAVLPVGKTEATVGVGPAEDTRPVLGPTPNDWHAASAARTAANAATHAESSPAEHGRFPNMRRIAFNLFRLAPQPRGIAPGGRQRDASGASAKSCTAGACTSAWPRSNVFAGAG